MANDVGQQAVPEHVQALLAEESRLQGASGNNLRAAVLGANDGVLTNLNLIMGVAGAHMSNRAILITGVAGLLAGAFSMALGEWLSVQSSRELNLRQLAVESALLDACPAGERQELVELFQKKGLRPREAARIADRMLPNKDATLETMAREEWGIDPHHLGGSAWAAALYSFLLFSLGAIVPVLPFVFASGHVAIGASLALGGAAMFGMGAFTTRLTGRNGWWAGLRQLLFGFIAAGLTFVLGHLLDVAIAP